VPLRSATTLLATPALISDWADDRSGAAGAIDDDGGRGIRRYAPGAQHQFGAGHTDRARDVHGGIFVEPPDIENPDIGLVRHQACDLVRGQRGRVPPRLHQFAKRLGVGIDIDEQLKAGLLPGLQPAIELANIGVPQRRQTIGRRRHKTFAGVVDDDRHVLARQPDLGLEHDPASRHVGGEQRMAGGKGGLVPHIQQCDFIAQQQHAADLRGRDGGDGHGGLLWIGMRPTVAPLRVAIQLTVTLRLPYRH